MIYLFCALVFIVSGFVIRLLLKKKFQKNFKIIPLLGVVLAGVMIFLSAVVVIPTGYTGVKTKFGQIDPAVVPTGFSFKIPVVENVKKVSNKKQDIMVQEQIWGESSDKVQVYGAQFTVTFQINPEYAPYLYSTVSDLTYNLINDSMIASSFKDASAALTSKEVTVRGRIEPLTVSTLQNKVDEKYGKQAIIINQVIINDMNFEESYNEAIAQKNKAEMAYEEAQITNRTAIEKAEAQKTVAQTNAQAQAEAKKIAAQAEADSSLIIAKAQSEANLIVSESITPEVLAKMEMEARLEHGWVTVTGGNVLTSAGSGDSNE